MIKKNVFELEPSISIGEKKIDNGLLKQVNRRVDLRKQKNFDINTAIAPCILGKKKDFVDMQDSIHEKIITLLLTRELNPVKEDDKALDIDKLIALEKTKIEALQKQICNLQVKTKMMEKTYNEDGTHVQVSEANDISLYKSYNKLLYFIQKNIENA
jgi:hypothetical protein